MGYESKLYICKRTKITDKISYNEVLAAINMSKMDSDFVRLFDTKLDGDFFGMDGAMSRFDQRSDEDKPKLVDDYGYDLKYTSLDEVYDWCSEYMGKTTECPYRRIAVLNDMLCSIKAWFKTIGNEQLIVVHYGY